MTRPDRFLVAQPDHVEPTLAQAAQAAGAWALIDATRPGWRDQAEPLDADRVALRVDLDHAPEPVGLAILAPWRVTPDTVDDLAETIRTWQARGVPVAVEARSAEEGRRAVDAGADLLVARGTEGPGRVSDRSNLVLLPSLAELDVPVIAWGGAGPHATGALLVHAGAVVLDAQLYTLPEAGLPDAWTRALEAFDGSDVTALGTTVETPYHVHARVADQHVHELRETELASTEGAATRRAALREHAETQHAGWDEEPGTGLRPLGHDAAHASYFARFDGLEEALTWLADHVTDQLEAFALTENNPLAEAHGTRYPIVQGAMANVSEVPAFAKAVADAGALPFLAFASLREEWAREALEGTIDALDEDQPFGCGIIGLDVNAEKRDAHIRLLKQHQPPYALIAAGTAEQALEIEEAGVDTYLHTPSRGIVRQAVQMGLSRLVVEGNECGGHIGKLPSLVLWDQTLQETARHEIGTPLDVLLAGGIGDAASAAMAGTLAAGSRARVGALMGTAYLATEEAVDTGAIPDTYQDLVLTAKDTAVTGETVGIRARSAPTPFTEELSELEQTLLTDEIPLDERKQRFEHANLGATRLAARGLRRGDEGTYHEVPTDEQLHEGNYLMGQGAARIETRYTVDELHQRVTQDAEALAEAARARLADAGPWRPAPPSTDADPEPETRNDAVAVVGLGCVLPDAPSVDAFWENLMDGHVSIRDLPEERWPVPAAAHHRPNAPDGTYTLLGAFVEEDGFDPIEHRIPPTVAEQMDPAQRWAIDATQQALTDAGLDQVEDRDRWAVILGNAQGEQRSWTDRRLALREVQATLAGQDAIPADAQAEVEALVDEMLDEHPPITEDTMPGELSNVIAGRVCNTFDIGGPARTVDTACASSLAAAEEAIRQLREGAVDVAITGGVDRSMDPGAYAKFSAIGALSEEGSFPFDERASGFVMGEGCGILVLERLEDAIAAGHPVYAVVEGAGSSSDGAGKGITAPDEGGQARAIQRAWQDAGIDPATLTLVEAHGTGTPVGDPIEASTLDTLLDQAGADPGQVALGSVKANIGHLKSAAGAAGLMKAVLALHHGTVPGTPIETPTSEVDWSTSPLSLATEPQRLGDGRLRAGVSAFGFGGTNSHVVLASAPTSTPEETQPADAGRSIACVSGPSREAVAEHLAKPRSAWRFDREDPVRFALRDQATVPDAMRVLTGELPSDLALSKGICLAEGDPGELGIVFPGQGSQYPGMVLDLAEKHPAAREVLEAADQVLTPLLGRPLSAILALEGEEGQRALTPTEVCQPAVLTCDVAILRILEEQGIEPSIVAGHSLGEYAALVAAEVLSFEDALHAVSARGREMADVEVDDPGGLVALRAGPEDAEALIEGLDAWPANLNGPEQTVVAGTTPGLDAVEERAEEAGIQASRLPVSAAFHSPIVAPATEPLREVLDRVPIDPPSVPVIANTTGEPYPDDPDAIRDLLAEQVANPVRWTDTMAAFDAAGVDLVVEVGPKRVLATLARSNLPETMAVPTAHPRQGAEETFETARLTLAAHGHLHAEPPTLEPRAEGSPQDPVPARRDRPASPSRPKRTAAKRQVVVSGVSLGLPSPDPDGGDAFDPDAVDALLSGANRIGPVPTRERDRMASMGVTRLVKDGPSGPRLDPIEDPSEVVKLAGRVPEVDLSAYDAEEDWLADADPTARLAVAAALEALTDARIPLVPDERETSTGTTLVDGWVLPGPLQGETGVILASAFPGDASLVDAVTQHAPSHTGNGQTPTPSGEGLTSYLADLVPHLEDRAARKTALDLLTQHADAQASPTDPTVNGAAMPGEAKADADGFPRDFLFRSLAMGHAQVAQLIRAKGPNLQVNAACASTTAAIALAQDWIEQDRCERVIVLGADVAGNEDLLPWIGSGFLAAGAASTSEAVDEAALPFDERRHGMLVGSGAVGLVLETRDAAEDRGVTPLAELVHAHVANSAYHGARLDPEHVADETRAFIQDAGARLDMTREELARELVFVSHEPATPARGGSAEAEVEALRSALGEHAGEVLISNTKGLTGHAMGAGIEDAIAVEALRARQAPPVANLEQVDPAFQDLTFSQGQATDRSLSLRFAAGFGSQVALACFHRTSPTPGALDEARFDTWLAHVAGDDASTIRQDRCLRVTREPTTTDAPATRQAQTAPTAPAPAPEAPTSEAPTPETPTPSTDAAAVLDLLTDLVSTKTGYPEDVIEPEMDLEADLGVDTVKQAEVLSEARDQLGIPPIEGLSLSEVPTLQQAADTLAEHAGATGSPDPTPTPSEPEPEQAEPEATEPAPDQGSDTVETDTVLELLTELVAVKTGYPEDVIEPEMDLEADLGVDTVKQAEVLSEARDQLGIPPIEGLSLSEVPTLQQAADTLAQHAGTETTTAPAAAEPASETPADAGPTGIRVLEMRRTQAAPADPLPEATRVAITGEPPAPMVDALTERTGPLVDPDAADLLAVWTGELSADPASLASLLEHLQGLPEADRTVLLARGEPGLEGLAPLARTLGQEGRPTRAVALPEGVPEERIAAEVLADTDADVHLGSQARTRLTLAPAGSTGAKALPEEATVLAPGGLGAAVVPCLERIARDHALRIAIAGRSPVEPNELDPDDEEAVDALRDELLAQAREAGETVRPAEIEAKVQARVRQARRHQALSRLDTVAEVRYDRVDATDPDQVAHWVDAVEEAWDTPDLVVHGTGVERSRAFLEKPREEIDLVLSAKLTPVDLLTSHLPDAHHVAFGSIAGVMGNPGQADYAVANGTLASLLDPVDGTVVHWTAWDAAGGMADDDTVRTVLEDRGVAFLDPDDGARIFAERCTTPGLHIVADLEPDTRLEETPPGARLPVTGEEDWLQDHSIGARPLVPGVRHLQAMREAAAVKGQHVRALHEVRFESALWVTEPLDAEIVVDAPGVRVEREGTLHARARLGPDVGAKPLDPVAAPEGELAREEIYERFFHGPSFQVLERVDPTPETVTAQADLSTGGAAPWAMALEACMQAASLGDLAAEADLGLPAGVEEVHIEAAPTTGDAIVAATLVRRDLGGSTWDATVRDPEGTVLFVARGIRLEGMGVATRYVDALSPLTDGSDAAVGLARVAPHEPRDPRAKRAAERAAGTHAAERALSSTHGEPVEIDRDEDGRPRPVDTPGGVSITHGHGLAVALADPSRTAIGVDLERVETRSDAWLTDHTTETERAWIRAHEDPDLAATLAWTLKEAASKALGTGLSVPTDELVVTIEEATARVETPEGRLEGRWVTHEGAVVSIAYPA